MPALSATTITVPTMKICTTFAQPADVDVDVLRKMWMDEGGGRVCDVRCIPEV
jgi:hypothetical protein